MRFSAAFFLLTIFAASPLLAGECQDTADAYRYENLQRLARLEDAFVQSSWYYRRHQETLYNPLWRAMRLASDPYSAAQSADGETLTDRYRNEAEGYLERARGKVEVFQQELQGMRDAGLLSGECGSGPFENCMAPWVEKYQKSLEDLGRALEAYRRDQEHLSGSIVPTLEEPPSDHGRFEVRYQEVFAAWSQRTAPAIMVLEREIRERFESGWRAPRCCASCAADPASIKDPVLKEIRLDPDGTRGADAGIVTNTGLLEAFESMEADSELQKEEES